MPAGDVFGLDGFFLNKSNPITVSSVEINSTASGAGITVTAGTLDTTAGIATLTFDTAAGLSTTPFYTGAKIAVSGLSTAGVAYTGYNGVFVVTGFAGTTTVSYATTGYVGGVTAGITTTGLVMLVTDTAVTNTTWSSAQTHGWFGGGNMNPGYLSIIDRIDFSNDSVTASPRGPLSVARPYLAATGNSNYGWFGGGRNPATISLVDRIDFSNDSSTASVRGPLTSAKYNVAATGNSNYGWFGGGLTTGPIAPISIVDRIDFSNDSGTSISRGLLSLSRVASATGNSNYGWFGGGTTFPGPIISTVDRIDFSNDSSTASVRGPLTSARYSGAATGNSNYGWFGGGTTFPGPIISTVDRIDFSNDATTASPRRPLSLARNSLAATGNSNYGWFGGGWLPSPPTPIYYSRVERIDFSNDLATASTRGPLSQARQSLAATGNSNYGWFGGALFPSSSSTVDRINFSNDLATASVRGPLSAAKGDPSATSGQARSRSTTIPKTGTYGWFGGGITSPGLVSRVERIDFSNDTSISVRGILSLSRRSVAGVGNINYGWFGGGFLPATTYYSTVDRIDYSNDGVQAAVRGTLTAASGENSSAGNSSYGWFSGGSPFFNAGSGGHQRIDYSNDLLTVRRTIVSNTTNSLGCGAAGNTNYGWWGSGNGGGSLYLRLDYSNDSLGFPSRGTSNYSSRFNMDQSAVSNQNYGWWGGGYTASNEITSVERINFANDLSKTLIRTYLNSPSPGRAYAAAAGNSDYGWWGGGIVPVNVYFSLVDRITYVNDTAVISARTVLAQGARGGMGATSNTNIG